MDTVFENKNNPPQGIRLLKIEEVADIPNVSRSFGCRMLIVETISVVRPVSEYIRTWVALPTSNKKFSSALYEKVGISGNPYIRGDNKYSAFIPRF
jgi:hypothetical protein